ncbi:MAG TPA: alanine racemase [Actinomycetota bacterium]|nr:alanine racemase [Actinomycetota bacterium]
MNLDRDELTVWAEVDVGAIRRNTERLRGLLSPGTELLAVVKADGYGHGAIAVARAALAGGAGWLGVARVHEGEALREAGITAPILLLAEPVAGATAKAVALGLTPTLYTAESARRIAAAARQAGTKLPVHVKVDTGMHRYGVPPHAVPGFLEGLRDEPALDLQGIWSHFAVAEDVLNPYTKAQFEAFSDVLEGLGRRADGLIRHMANSAATLSFPEAHLDMVRSGIAVYGIHPDPGLADRLELEPAMSFRTRVGFTKTLAAGESVSYGQRYVMPAEGHVASIPCGYADGFRRALTNQGEVLIRGRRYRVAGTVTMDHLMVDAGEDELAPGDEVTILGRQEGDAITAQEVATRLGTIPYEVVCGLSARVPRLYVDS